MFRAFATRGLTTEERSRTDVQEALRERFTAALRLSVLGVPPTALCIIAVLWRHANQTGLLVWASLVLLNAIAHWIGHLGSRQPKNWLRTVVMLQFMSGSTWGSLAYLAPPPSPEWQMFIVALFMGVCAVNILSAIIRPAFYAYVISLAVVTVSGLAINGVGAGQWGAGLLAYGAIFSMGLAEVSRNSDVAASVFAVRSVDLAKGLETERARLHEANLKLARQASTDSLTQLPNRFEFLRQLDEAVASSPVTAEHTLGVAYLDLDGFKQINDTMGHDVGDQLLVAIGGRIRSCLGESETAARIGGDEMVVLARELRHDGGVEELGQRLRDCFDAPFALNGRHVACRCSIGIAVFDELMTAEDLIRFADVGLYNAKAAGGGVEVFSSEMRSTISNQKFRRDELIAAFEQGLITPYVQPVVDLHTGAIVGGEALARWEHPDGLRTAGSFMELVHEVGLVDELNKLVIGRVSDLGQLIRAETGEEMPIGVNVTFESLERVVADFVSTDALDSLVIEIADKTSLLPVAEIRDHVERVREMGVTVLLNDFGIGMASLAVAMELPVDGLKFDRQLLADLYDESRGVAVAAALIKLANQLDLEIVAQGIESENQLAMLRAFGVRVGQGFLFAPAVPMSTFHDWVLENKTFLMPSEQAAIG